MNQRILTLLLKLTDLFSKELLVNMNDIPIINYHRISKSTIKGGPKDVIVRFANNVANIKVLSQSYRLKGRASPLFINDQYPKEIENQRTVLYPVIKLAKKEKKKCSLSQGKLFFQDKAYTMENIHEISLDTNAIGTVLTSCLVVDTLCLVTSIPNQLYLLTRMESHSTAQNNIISMLKQSTTVT